MQLIHGDCLEKMKDIPDMSIDLCVTDPPYKLTSGGCCGSIDIVFNRSTKEGKSRGQFFDIPPFYIWIHECFRVLKQGSHFYCMSNQKNLIEMITQAEMVGFRMLNLLVWDKGMHTPLGYYMQNVEFIILFRKGKAKKINQLGSKALISIKGIYGNKVHPSEKPSILMEHFVINSSNEGEIVLDPFMGSGSTGVACINTNRNFIGIEKDDTYFEIAKNRINNHLTDGDADANARRT